MPIEAEIEYIATRIRRVDEPLDSTLLQADNIENLYL